MTRNRRLARALADQGFGRALRMPGSKTSWNGGCFVLAGRWFPSSKMCSGCGAVKAKLPMSQRTDRCGCGLVTGRQRSDRDRQRATAGGGTRAHSAH
jgi:putative transposase